MIEPLYQEWNAKINVISRTDISNLMVHHVLHSLSIAKVISFTPGTEVLDVGTGGGFPGIPLAILFPGTRFHLVDSIGKKIHVAESVSDALGLQNVTTEQARAESVKGAFDFVLGRAVATLPSFYDLVKGKVKKENNNALPNGILYLKGGDVEDEIRAVKAAATIYNLSDYFTEPYFSTKKLIHLSRK